MSILLGHTHFPREISRNQHECIMLARSIDLMVDELGLEVIGDLTVTEVLLRRLKALLQNTRTGSWEYAIGLEESPASLLRVSPAAAKETSQRVNISKSASPKGTSQSGTGSKPSGVAKK